MEVTGIHWILTCTANFDETVSFFRDIMKIPLRAQGRAVTDLRFARYATFTFPNDVTIEVVEPAENGTPLGTSPIVAIRVDDLASSRKELEEKGIQLLGPILDGKDGAGWFYFRAPDGNVYEMEGPYP